MKNRSFDHSFKDSHLKDDNLGRDSDRNLLTENLKRHSEASNVDIYGKNGSSDSQKPVLNVSRQHAPINMEYSNYLKQEIERKHQDK